MQLFQDGECVANAETVIVQVNDNTGRSSPLTGNAKTTLNAWLLSDF